ncbi:hypothetical protein KC345_g301 [Hortaea werneckii]|nr:hypothetical protein KC345_g301 [Hortaea werneckii]
MDPKRRPRFRSPTFGKQSLSGKESRRMSASSGGDSPQSASSFGRPPIALSYSRHTQQRSPSSPPRKRAEMGFLSSLYGSIVKRNTTFLATIFVGAFATEIAFETGANSIWDQINKGRQWKDIKQRYMEASDE